MRPAEHIREMIVATAVVRTAADRAAIAGAAATTRSRRTIAGRSLPGTLMATIVGAVETVTATTVAEEGAVMIAMEGAMEVGEVDVAVTRRTGRNRLRGMRESKLNSLALGRWPGVESTLTDTRISRLKRLVTTCPPASSRLPRWSSRP